MRHQKGFSSEDELIAAVLDAQFNEPVADLTEESWYEMPFLYCSITVTKSLLTQKYNEKFVPGLTILCPLFRLMDLFHF